MNFAKFTISSELSVFINEIKLYSFAQINTSLSTVHLSVEYHYKLHNEKLREIHLQPQIYWIFQTTGTVYPQMKYPHLNL